MQNEARSELPHDRCPGGHGARFRLSAAVSLTIVLTGACASTKRGPVADNVVASRELSFSGMEAIQRGQWEQAELLFNQAIEACPTDERARSRYAEILWRRGATDNAITHMGEAVRLSGGDPGLLVRLGEMYLAAGQLQQAANKAEQAISRNRRFAPAWALNGDVLYHQHRWEDALASYHRALGYQPQYPQVQLAAAQIYSQTNRPQRALTTLEALAEQFPPGHEPREVLVRHGLALKTLKRYDEALESLTAASQRGEPSAEILYQVSEIQLLAGDFANARLSVLAALQVDPYHSASRQLQAQLERRQQQMTVSLRP